MATISEDVKLTGPDNWKAWNERFKSEAVTRDLWELIDPKSTSKGQFKTAPIKPAIKDYPKRLDRADAPPAQSTRAGSATSSATAGESQALTIGPTAEEVDRRNPPRNTSEMTTLGRDAYKTDLSEYHFEWRLYEAERQNLNRLTAWIRQTVASQLYDTTCKADKTIDQWYEALKERAGSDDREELQQAMKQYNAAITPLARKPKDMLGWLARWETALLGAQEANLPGSSSSQLWWLQFEAAVKGAGYESWCESYYNSNQNAINDNTLTLRKLSKDFSNRVHKDTNNHQSSIAKGAFPTYAEQQKEEEKHHEHREPRTRTRSPAPRSRQHTPNRSRSRSPGARGAHNYGHKRKHTGGAESGCPACDGLHPLSDCWALFPELRPSYYPPAYRKELLAKGRLEKDPELLKQVEALRKRVKREDTLVKEVRFADEQH
jgi:hypothetical protein